MRRRTISEAQRRVLISLCRPYREGGAFAVPPTNAEIAAELVIGVDTVKAHMRALYDRFGVGDVPQQRKRAALVEVAFRSGEIALRDLDGRARRTGRRGRETRDRRSWFLANL